MTPPLSTTQLVLDFEPGLSERWPTLMDYVRHCVHSQPKPMKTIAADMDLSASDLSRKLSENPSDPRRFTADDLDHYIAATGDHRPIRWLVERYMAGRHDKREALIEQLSQILPGLIQLVASEQRKGTP